MVDADHLGFSVFGEGASEIGDMCFMTNQLFYDAHDMPFTVQRLWSNAAAEQGDPCIPALPGIPYFNSVPVDEKISIYVADAWVATRGAHIPIGTSKTIELALFSTEPTEPWNVLAAEIVAAGAEPALELGLDKNSGKNGDHLQLTIHVKQAPGFKALPNTAALLIHSKLGATQNNWPMLIAVGS
jgi:hypothetical protein